MDELGQKIALIKKQKCFSALTDAEFIDLAALCTKMTFAEGDEIVTEGDPVNSIYFIQAGTANVRVASLKNHIIHWRTVSKLGEGEAIGLNETGFYSLSGLRTATVIAKTKVVAYCLKMTEFHGYALANHHVSEIMQHNAEEFMKK